MNKMIKKHPSLIFNQDIQTICNPLKKLNIDYFCHVLVTSDNYFSTLGTNAEFTEHYLKNQYYNVDLHMANIKNLTFLVWDMIERYGLTAQMHSEAALFGVKHTFTIIENNIEGRHCYHFANSGDSPSINQCYLSNLDLLKAFISYFKETVQKSKELENAYRLKFKIDSNAKGYQTDSDMYFLNAHDKNAYLEMLRNTSLSKKIILCNKNINKTIQLSPQQSKCMHLLAAGHTNKQIAKILGLSYRTVENYFYHIRHILHCRSGKELIALYHARDLLEIS